RARTMKKSAKRRTRILGGAALLSAAILGAGWGVSEANASEPAATPAFAAALTPFVESGSAPGAVVVVASPTEILAVEAVGWADVEAKRSMRADSYFWIASQTKAVVAAAVMICVDEGKLDLDAPVETYLPELRGLVVAEPQEDGTTLLRPTKTSPTLRQALSHTAGFRFITPYQEAFGIDSLPVRRLMKTVAMTPLIEEPGTRYSYSNLGVDVAQAAVEAVVGKSFEKFVEERIFAPLEMTATTFYPDAGQLDYYLATPYGWDADAGRLKPIRFAQMPSLDDGSPRYAEGGGGLFSTAEDFVKFYQMLAGRGVGANGKRVLSDKAVETMTSKQTGAVVDAQYGFGLTVDDRTFGHGGALGTQGVVYRDGTVGVYLVAVGGTPKQGEMERAFRSVLEKIATERSEKAENDAEK
ncbi:MAG: beta-lactamase family protein, partial [Thermoguttaceae bacterium]|nr:beta-lactamase family protein [Thermoguttaceae bacterium]